MRAVLSIVVALLAGCANQAKLQQAELDELAAWLPGSYVSSGESAAGNGGSAGQALALVITPIYAAPLGRHAFYLQEMAADDARRVTRQQVLAFDVDGEDRIVQGVYSLAEPLRWRDAHMNPDLFKGVIPHEDLRPATGCELIWKREDARFVGTNDPVRCRTLSRQAGTTVRLDYRAELTPDELVVTEQAYHLSGRELGPASVQRFRKGVR